MTVHRIKLPHKLVQLGDVFQTREGGLFVVAVDRGGRNAHCIVAAKGDEWSPFVGYPLETLAELHGIKGDPDEVEPATTRQAAE
jgi:hypothetical protein